MRRFRERRPIKAAYATLRDHSRERGIGFTITYDYFEKLAIEKGVFIGGKRNPDMHFDRIDATRGYADDNVQALTGYENIAKGNKERWHEEYKRRFRERNPTRQRYRAEAPTIPNDEEDDDPFGAKGTSDIKVGAGVEADEPF